jgi:hypothetical protein
MCNKLGMLIGLLKSIFLLPPAIYDSYVNTLPKLLVLATVKDIAP